MNIGKAEKEVEKRQADLDKLKGEFTRLQETIQALQSERDKSIRELASIPPDDAKAGGLRKKVNDTEAKMKEPSLRAEGLRTLIEESEQEAEKSRTVLKEAEEETKVRLAVFIQEKEAARWNNFVNSLPARRIEFFRLYLSLCSLIGEVEICGTFIDSDGNTHRSPELETFLVDLASLNESYWKAAGYRRFPWTGGVDRVHVIPLFVGEEGIPKTGPIDAVDVAQIRRKKRIADLEAEFQRKENSR